MNARHGNPGAGGYSGLAPGIEALLTFDNTSTLFLVANLSWKF